MSDSQYHGLKKTVTRFKDSQSYTITAAAGTTVEIDTQGRTICSIRSPDSDITTLTYFASTVEGGTYTQIQVTGADASTTLTTNKWNDVDPELSVHRWLKIVGNAAGDIDVNWLG